MDATADPVRPPERELTERWLQVSSDCLSALRELKGGPVPNWAAAYTADDLAEAVLRLENIGAYLSRAPVFDPPASR